MLEREHPVYLETVAFRNIARFTLLQLVYMLAVWGVTWAGAVGIAFPFLIVLLIPGRQYLMPKVRMPLLRPVPRHNLLRFLCVRMCTWRAECVCLATSTGHTARRTDNHHTAL